jgi:hypothetical protein
MPWRDTQSSRLRRLFLEGFSAMDIAEPLVSFDESARVEDVKEFMIEKDFDLVGIRQNGLVEGYVRRDELASGPCSEYFRPFTPDDDLVPDSANLTEVVKSLAINKKCFVTILDRVGAIITLTDLEKPPMRMFMFGIITLGEMVAFNGYLILIAEPARQMVWLVNTAGEAGAGKGRYPCLGGS